MSYNPGTFRCFRLLFTGYNPYGSCLGYSVDLSQIELFGSLYSLYKLKCSFTIKDALFVNYSNFAQMKFFIFGLLREGKKSKKCTKIAKNLIFSPREVGTDYTFQVEQF